ncbi:hypothetical protein QBC40DRAFT_330782 [Triangularia verruculosa]|uniref:Uncharacterized protein n=1 Tax=Triangularia verruculosa TaxID=2587418 RepID=A0AAN6XQ45_9PEZI|nr:hypothetical protein QBC40DRAFT_330782 [Triangularia verruculosa]
MTDYHRGRRRSHRDYDYDDSYYGGYEHRPRRHRSLGRQALDKVEGAMENLGLDDKHSARSRSRHARGYDKDYDRDHHRHGSSSYSGSRHHSGSHGHHTNRSRRPHHDDHYTSRRRAHSSSPTRRTRHRSTHSSSYADPATRSRSRARMDKGLKAAVDAAAIEAFRVRNQPGSWTGAKGARVATAALSAGAIGAAAEKRKEEHGSSKMGTMGSALTGMAVNRLVNGPRRDLR